MPTIHTSIDIAAPPEKVWAALTDYERYPEWNPFMRRIEGDRRGAFHSFLIFPVCVW